MSDYELMMNGSVKLGQKAPDFTANSTMGKISLKNYLGKWVVLFSYTGDFSPVCTTEIIAFSRANTYFENENTKLIGLSVDSNASHLAWLYDIYIKTGLTVPFPIIADRTSQIARQYGMFSQNENSEAAIRSTFIIDEKGIVRAVFTYPENIGRNISEILRVVNTLQIAEKEQIMVPANWMPYDPMIMMPPTNFKAVQERSNEIAKERNGMEWYICFKHPENT